MDFDEHKDSSEGIPNLVEPRRVSARIVLNSAIIVLLLFLGYFSYAFISSTFTQTSAKKEPQKPPRVIQLDVLNGCGVKGVGIRFTNYLRSHGFDVVEIKNYKTFHIPRTLVVDRVGDLESARRVAASLGVLSQNIIQQINSDYFVDVSVIIGEDYANLQISQ